MYYVAKDHLGSILALFNADHTKVQENSFDAWGRRRNPSDWTYTNIPTPSITNRGFTTHEHLDDFALINMLSEAKSRSEAAAGNGRVYDPVLGRFLSPDPFIQAPDFAQNFNRYSYVYNNPLKYIDPSGYSSVWPFRKWKHTYQKRVRREGAVWFGDEDVFNDPFGTDYIFYDGIGTSGGGGGASGSGGPGGPSGGNGGGGHGVGGSTLPDGGDGDPPRVINSSKKIIWFKPEGDYTDPSDGRVYKNDQAYPIIPGHWTTVPIDGVNINGEVFKITNGCDLVIVDEDGDYQTFYPNPAKYWYYSINGGKITSKPDDSWSDLFNH